MAVAGALIGGAIGAFGRKPEIPTLPGIDPSQIQQATISGNLDALGDAQRLGAAVNQFNLDQALANTRRALEFFAPGQLGQVQSITNDQLAGRIPEDVQASVLRSSAGRAFGQGTAGSQFASNLGLRDLGLTSLGIQQQGIANFGNLASLRPDVPMFNVSSMFFTPQQRLQFAFEERSAQFNRNLMAEQVAAAPDPATAALGREIDRFFNTAAQFGMMAGGAAMGGGGGGMMGGGGGGPSASPNAFGSGSMNGWGNWLNSQVNAGSANGGTIGG